VKQAISVLRGLFEALRNEYYSGRILSVHALAFLTYRCTSKCRTCNIWRRNGKGFNKEMDLEQWKNVLINLRDYGLRTLEIFGGDALLRKDLIYEVIELCSTNGIKTYFPTNGILLDRYTAKCLVESGLDTIYFSVDDIGQEHDRIRGKDGTFALVKNAIDNISRERKNNKPSIIICTTISSMNYNHFENILNFLSEFPIDAIYPRILEQFSEDNINNSIIDGIKPEPYFTASDGSSHLLNDLEVDVFRQIIKDLRSVKKRNRAYINYRNVDMAADETFAKGIRPLSKCLACTTLGTIDPFGNVMPCPMYSRYKLGNLLEDKMEDVWGNERHCFFIKNQRQKNILICRNCSLKEYYPSLSETLIYYTKRMQNRLTGN
jgi:radical SAM protein with 4Fe4S-binding SPASM domain